MIRTIPQFILEKAEQNAVHGSFLALVAYFDITGFTHLTQSLIKFQNEGLENLGSMINQVFSPCLDIIGNYDGFISTFAGDSFTAVFQLPEGYTKNHLVDKVLPACFAVRDFFINEGVQDTSLGRFEFFCKTGVSFGRVEWGIINNSVHNSYYFLGESIKSAVASSEKAAGNEIIIDQTIRSMLGSDYNTKQKETHYFSLETKKEVADKPVRNLSPDPKYLNIQKQFTDANIILENIHGEFRDVLACFISLDETSPIIKDTVSPLKIINLFSEIISLCHQYGGYFNKIDFGDKGIIILIIFGAPKTTEKIFQRGMEFALQLKRNLLKLPSQNEAQSLRFKIGLSYGTSYTGFIGSRHRGEYTALGMILNKAARYAKIAEWNEIIFDDTIETSIKENFKYKHYQFMEIKSTKFKLKTYELLRKLKKTEKKYLLDSFVGRKNEIVTVFQQILHKNTFEPQPLILLNGAAGIGKTRFLTHLMSLNQDKELNWIDISFDECNNSFYYAILDYFRRLFNFDPDTPVQEISNTINNYLSQILDQIETIVSQNTTHYDEHEYTFIRNFLPLLSNPLQKLLYSSEKLYSEDPELQKQEKTTLLNGLRALITALTYLQNTILVLDDYHWADSASLTFIKHLLKNTPKNLNLIFSYRPDISLSEEEFLKSHPYLQINLQFFEFDQINSFLQERFNLKHSLPEHTVMKIYDITGGNPFYLEQTYIFLEDSNLINKQGELKIKDIKLSYNISNIIVSRLDKLSNNLKNVLKTASILGMEFSVNILTEMLRTLHNNKDLDISDVLLEGEREQIWRKIDNLNYIFKHSLLRESIYNMQFLDQIKKLHNLAAEIYENFYQSNTGQHCISILKHYEKAGNKNKTSEYLLKAAKYSFALFQIQEAIDFYSKFLIQNIDPELNLNTLLNRAVLYSLIFKNDQALQEINYVIEYAQKSLNYTVLFRSYILLGKLSIFQLNYETASTHFTHALEYSFLTQNDQNICICYTYLVNMCMYKMDLKNCKIYLDKQCQLAEKINSPKVLSLAYGNLGTYQTYKRDYESALSNLTLWHDMSLEMGDLLSANKALLAIATLELQRSNYSTAKNMFLKCLNFAEKTSNLLIIQKTFYSLGRLHYIVGEINLAENFLINGLNYAKSVNDLLGISNVAFELGKLYNDSGKKDLALEYFYLSEKILLEHKLYSRLFKVYTSILVLFKAMDNKEKYQEYLQKMEQLIKANDIALNPNVSYNLARAYFHNDDFAKALQILQEIESSYLIPGKNPVTYLNLKGLVYLNLKNLSAAHTCFTDALYFLHKNPNNKELSMLYGNIGEYWLEMQNYVNALKYYAEAEKLKKSLNIQNGLCDIYDGLTQTYLLLQNKEEALRYCDLLEHTIEATQDKEYSKNLADYREKLSRNAGFSR